MITIVEEPQKLLILIFFGLRLLLGDYISYSKALFIARVVEWQTRMLEGHVGRPVGVRVPLRAPYIINRKILILRFFCFSE